MRAILAIGTSAGGARPKAIIAFNEKTGQVRSGQLDAEPGFEHWLLKFDGVAKAGDHGLTDPEGWGAVEYAYWRMARAAGVEMTESRLLAENGRRHFLTRRFDRPPGDKLHVQTLGALDHISYRMPGVYGYDQAMLLMRRIGIELPQIEQLFRRMVFNVVARNQDDHVKNIAFLMDRAGRWSLAPAYDVTWACDPTNRWLQAHQMTINGKRERIIVEDLVAIEKRIGLKRGTAKRVLREVTEVVATWPQIAEDVAVEPAMLPAPSSGRCRWYCRRGQAAQGTPRCGTSALQIAVRRMIGRLGVPLARRDHDGVRLVRARAGKPSFASPAAGSRAGASGGSAGPRSCSGSRPCHRRW